MNPYLSTRSAVAGAALVAAAVLLPTSAAHALDETCQGRPATIVATGRTIEGTPGPDVIVTVGDLAIVDAGAGDDTVCLRSGSAEVDAGPGNDSVDASQMSQHTYARTELGPGSDVYLGGAARDYVDTGDGHDQDVVTTGDDKDVVTVESDVARVATQNGHDHIVMESQNPLGGSLLMGRAPDDILVVAPAASVTVDQRHRSLDIGATHYPLVGAEAADVLADRAHLVGDEHRNLLSAYSCTAEIVGADGDDRLQVNGRNDNPEYPTSPDGCHGVRSRVFGGPGADVLRSDRGHSVLDGGPGFDKAFGGSHGSAVCHAERRSSCHG